MEFKKGIAFSLVMVVFLLSACDDKVSVPTENPVIEAKELQGESREEKIAHLYEMKREHLSNEDYVVADGLKKELGIDSQVLHEDVVESVLINVLSRKDGSTNETKDPYVKVMTPYTYQQARVHFERWTNGEIDSEKLQERWDDLLVDAVYPMKTTVVIEERFPKEEDILTLVDNMVQHIGETAGTTAPHILSVKVKKDEISEEFLLYLALAEIE